MGVGGVARGEDEIPWTAFWDMAFVRGREVEAEEEGVMETIASSGMSCLECVVLCVVCCVASRGLHKPQARN